jgi:hypothetical protein
MIPVQEFSEQRRALEIQYQVEAEAIAAQHGYDTHALHSLFTSYQFGSRANNWDAADMRRVYWRAYWIAAERKRAADEQPIAAE